MNYQKMRENVASSNLENNVKDVLYAIIAELELRSK